MKENVHAVDHNQSKIDTTIYAGPPSSTWRYSNCQDINFLTCELVVNYSVVNNMPRVVKRNSYTIHYKQEDKFYFWKGITIFSVNQNVVASVQRLAVISRDPFMHDSIPMVVLRAIPL